MPARRIRITGRVQGVFFRATACEKARHLNICGWVRNADDGSVEIHAEGSDQSLDALERWCHDGPDGADVKMVKARTTREERCRTFEIRS